MTQEIRHIKARWVINFNNQNLGQVAKYEVGMIMKITAIDYHENSLTLESVNEEPLK